ncbi:GNAT family acetyltransferase [Paenibacillus pectinilyticus]|uniref:GNAT family acetyltransferase n=1 Tax=Paenibacillus pectinilyticus TaxID=512399 RepID=A0A1C0ZZ26_9BACL|nr:GNAT family N-acetyltransferase [Paenibacillus pectinilyticus]OCT13397.1 GNAT family acetyltransferase [Paenibacillus pectinilyticus]
MEIKIIPKEATWQLRHQVMWPEKDLAYVKLVDDDAGIHYGLFERDQLVSVVSLFIEGKEAQFRKFATLETHQNKGLGTQLLTFMLDAASQAGVERIYCNARSSKALFYAKFGFQETTTRFTKGGKDYLIMERWSHPVNLRNGKETPHHDS